MPIFIAGTGVTVEFGRGDVLISTATTMGDTRPSELVFEHVLAQEPGTYRICCDDDSCPEHAPRAFPLRLRFGGPESVDT